MEKMSDAELIKKLEYYGRIENFWALFVLPGIAVSGLIGFVGKQAVLGAGLFFICLSGFLLIGDWARKKKKNLICEQLQDYFKSQLENTFGQEQFRPDFMINEGQIRDQGFFKEDWEECEIENAYAGKYKGRYFSAANVGLKHVYEIKRDRAYEKRSVDVFKGLWVVFETVHSVSERICICADDQIEEMKVIQELEKAVSGKIEACSQEKNRLCLAITTYKRFADVQEETDIRDINQLRLSFTRSLTGVKELLDVLIREKI